MAALPFVDTHVHFYDRRSTRLRYDWLGPGGDPGETEMIGEYGSIRSEHYLADDFVAETRFHHVTGTVHVQAAIGSDDPVDETRWLQETADRIGTPDAMIAAVDLARGDAAEQIERHREFAGFRGVRDLRDDDYLTDDAWRRGCSALDGLVCCDDPFVEDMQRARRLADQLPGVTFCVDHAAYPGFGGRPRSAAAADFTAWRDGLRGLAAAENVVVKISGLGMSDHAWTVESIRPWVLECIEIFGTRRSFFGTNWPLDRLYSSYGDVIDAYAAIIADFTDAEQRALFAGNAERIFRLGDGGS